MGQPGEIVEATESNGLVKQSLHLQLLALMWKLDGGKELAHLDDQVGLATKSYGFENFYNKVVNRGRKRDDHDNLQFSKTNIEMMMMSQHQQPMIQPLQQMLCMLHMVRMWTIHLARLGRDLMPRLVMTKKQQDQRNDRRGW